MAKEYCRWKIVEPENNWVDEAEISIQTFKNNFISVLYTTESEWKVKLCDQLEEQAVITINPLRASLINAEKSAYHKSHGCKYDCNLHSMTPSGSRWFIYKDPNSRAMWVT